MSSILLLHRKRTIRWMKAQRTVLCIQDGSDLNYSSLDKCDGLGIIGSNQTSARSKGLHSTIAAAPNGLPLGCYVQNVIPRYPDPKRTVSVILKRDGEGSLKVKRN